MKYNLLHVEILLAKFRYAEQAQSAVEALKEREFNNKKV